MKTPALLACLCLSLPAFAAAFEPAPLSQQLSQGSPQNASAAASFFNTGLAELDSGNSIEALASLSKATQHSISDARFWYHRFATETALGKEAAATFSLKVASTARAMHPGREKELLAGISSIQGTLRQQIVIDYLTTRLALSSGKTAEQIIATALEPKNSPTEVLNSRLVTLRQSEEVAALSKPQTVASGMLLGEEPIAGVTVEDLASFKNASQLQNENDTTWANRLASGLEIGTNEVTWRLDACAENASNFQEIVLTKIIGEILQKTASQEEYERLVENIKVDANWVDCDPADEQTTEADPVRPEPTTQAEVILGCYWPCPDPCVRPARRCFLSR